MNKILETLEAEREELADWRHDFHMHPELVLKNANGGDRGAKASLLGY